MAGQISTKGARAKAGRKRSAADRLTPKEARFVERYLLDLNGAAAARSAGYSPRTAARQALALLNRPHIARAIARAMEERSRRAKVDADWLLKRLVGEADADLADLFDPQTGALRPVQDWPLEWRRGLVAGIEVEEIFGSTEDGAKPVIGYTRKVKLADRAKRIEMIGRHVDVSAFRDRVKHEVDEDGPLARLMQQIAGRAIAPKEPGTPKEPSTSADPSAIRPKE